MSDWQALVKLIKELRQTVSGLEKKQADLQAKIAALEKQVTFLQGRLSVTGSPAHKKPGDQVTPKPPAPEKEEKEERPAATAPAPAQQTTPAASQNKEGSQ